MLLLLQILRLHSVLLQFVQAKDLAAYKQWQLLQDTRKVIDCSPASLRRLYDIFASSLGANSDQILIGPRTFRLALANHGVRDVILMQRLYGEFCNSSDSEKLDFRAFVGTLCSVSEASIEDKLDLLFDVWDVDESGSLTHHELAPIIIGMIPKHEVQMMTGQLTKVWNAIRTGKDEPGGASNWIGASRNSGMSKEDLIFACGKSPLVREFFRRVADRPAPAAKENKVSFKDRMRELHTDMIKERKEFDRLEQERRSKELLAGDADNEPNSPQDTSPGRRKSLRRAGSLRPSASTGSILPVPALPRRQSTKILGMESKSTLTKYKAQCATTMGTQQTAKSFTKSSSVSALPPIAGARVR